MNSYLPNLIPSGSQDHVGWEDAPFLARLTGVYTPSSGEQNQINLYSFIEQNRDPQSGIPFDAIGGRRTFPAAPAAPQVCFAVEVNNSLLTIPGSTPTGYANPGPYVWLKLSTNIPAAGPLYEFEISAGGTSSQSYFFDVTGDYTLMQLSGGLGQAYVYSGIVYTSPQATVGSGSSAYLLVNGDHIPTFGVLYEVTPYGATVNYNDSPYPVYFLDFRSPITEVSGAVVVVENSTDELFLNSNTINLGPYYQGAAIGRQTFPADGSPYAATNILFGGSYGGATGTDGIGNVFISGLNVQVGGASGTGGTSTLSTLDDGSFW